jgi:hypothetical protein
MGLRSENAAHRVAVEWDEDGAIRTGVFIPRRDSSSRLNALVSGRVFPGVHHHARFHVSETEDVVERGIGRGTHGRSATSVGRPVVAHTRVRTV